MSKILEVIVTSLAEAIEAERGGADRLEVVRQLSLDGMSPAPELLGILARAIKIPMRAMVRERPGFAPGGAEALEQLRRLAGKFAALPLDGLVVGFVNDHAVDEQATSAILAEAPHFKATFHRAFECIAEPFAAIRTLKSMPQIDRILTDGGPGSWPERQARLEAWQQAASPEIRILVGGGLAALQLSRLSAAPSLYEFHVGRAVRLPHSATGFVRRALVSDMKRRLS